MVSHQRSLGREHVSGVLTPFRASRDDGPPVVVRRELHRVPVGPVSYPFAKVVVIAAGWTVLAHRDQSATLAEGDVAILPTGAQIGGTPLPVVETVTLYVEPAFLRELLLWAGDYASPLVLLDAAARGSGGISIIRLPVSVRRRLTALARDLARQRSDDGLGLLGATASFLSMLGHPVTVPSAVPPRGEVRAVVAALRDDLARRWTSAELSHAVNLSQSQLARLFKAGLGAPPIAVLQRLRVERLAELLRTTDWSVQRCSTAVGWTDASYATRMMRRICGITPTQYRQAARSTRVEGA